jgi:hypothetical protein
VVGGRVEHPGTVLWIEGEQVGEGSF